MLEPLRHASDQVFGHSGGFAGSESLLLSHGALGAVAEALIAAPLPPVLLPLPSLAAPPLPFPPPEVESVDPEPVVAPPQAASVRPRATKSRRRERIVPRHEQVPYRFAGARNSVFHRSDDGDQWHNRGGRVRATRARSE
jgi:hypothetical protein